MPVLELVCRCGHRYLGLKSFSTADPDLERCPLCGGAPSRMLSAGVYHRALSVDEIPPEEMAEHLEAKLYYESLSERVLSGEIKLRERGPKELRPVCPEALRRKLF